MKNPLILARKDFSAFFYSWLGVIIIAFFFLIAGTFFSFFVLNYARLSAEGARNAYEGLEGLKMTHFIFSSFFLNMSVVLIFLVPVLTMRGFSEERRLQTLELLFTYPLSDFDIVWGKFVSVVCFFTVLLFPTLGYLALLQWLGGVIDWGPALMGYLGFWLLGISYLSLGLFISSLTDNQVISAVVTFGFLIFFWAIDWVSGVVDGMWAHFFTALSPLSHFREFVIGVLDLSHVVYFCFFILYFLFLTLRSIETRNWKG